MQFEGPDVVVCGTDISKKGWDKCDGPPPVVERTVRELLIALSLGSRHLDRRYDTATYIEGPL